MIRRLSILLLFLAGALSAVASPLAIELKAFAVEEVPGAEAKLTEVEVVRPGQLIEYRATFTNVSDKTLNGVVPEIPVPQELTVVLESIQPEQYTVSADGKRFVQRTALLGADGKPLGAEHIRAVRWAPAQLPPKGVLTTRLRAKVDE